MQSTAWRSLKTDFGWTSSVWRQTNFEQAFGQPMLTWVCRWQWTSRWQWRDKRMFLAATATTERACTETQATMTSHLVCNSHMHVRRSLKQWICLSIRSTLAWPNALVPRRGWRRSLIPLRCHQPCCHCNKNHSTYNYCICIMKS